MWNLSKGFQKVMTHLLFYNCIQYFNAICKPKSKNFMLINCKLWSSLSMWWLCINMATMYEHLCGKCASRVELTFVWHFIYVHLIFLYHCKLTWHFSKLRAYELSQKCELYPTYRVGTQHLVHSCHIYPQPFWITQSG
jgi:hypothetical protein